MPVLALDHVLALVLAVFYPVRATTFGFRRLARAGLADVPRLRVGLYRQGIAIQWALVALTLGLWVWQGRTWLALGLVPRLTWGLLGVVAGLVIVALYVLVQQRRALGEPEGVFRVRAQLRDIERLMPRTDHEMRWFYGVSITAGLCEELLYRGYLIWYLLHWLPLLPAALVSSLVFGFGHAYQGVRGVALTTLVGLFMSGLYLVTGSLAPCMVFHALMDLNAGHVARAALAREGMEHEARADEDAPPPG
jgi:membrane protease YdiL (CAAX protease family)